MTPFLHAFLPKTGGLEHNAQMVTIMLSKMKHKFWICKHSKIVFIFMRTILLCLIFAHVKQHLLAINVTAFIFNQL